MAETDKKHQNIHKPGSVPELDNISHRQAVVILPSFILRNYTKVDNTVRKKRVNTWP